MLSDAQRRRQARAARRSFRRAYWRRLLTKFVIAAVVLVLCGGLIYYITQKAPDTPSTNATKPTQPASPTVPSTTVIHFAAAGDLNITDKTVASGGSGYLYTNTFLDVAHLLGSADVSALNFEGNLCGAPYGSSHSAPQSMAEALRKMGVDLVQMANSYSINRGISGLTTSINAIRSAGMEPLGVYATNEDFKAGKGYTIRIVQGVKIRTYMEEKYYKDNCIGVQAFVTADGKLIAKSGVYEPIGGLKMKAS